MGRGGGRTSGEERRKDKWGGKEEGQVGRGGGKTSGEGRRKATSPSKRELPRAQHRQFALEIDSRCCDACGEEGLPVKDPPAVAVL